MIPSVAIPALIALVCKLGLLGYTTKLAGKSASMRLIQALLVIFALHNSVEFIGFIHFDGEVDTTIRRIGFAYFSFTILAVALILHLSLRLSLDFDSGSSWLRLQPVLYASGFALLYLLLATDQLVTGFQTYQGTVLRIPGRWYILFESYVVSYTLIALLSLVYGARASRRSARGRSRNRLWLAALVPSGLLILYLIVANHFGAAKITSTVYLPIPWAFFLLVATYSVYHSRLPDIGVFVLGSKARRRKMALYERARTIGAEIGTASSAEDMVDVLTRIFRCPVTLVGDHTALRTAGNNQTTSDGGEKASERFPEEVLRKVGRIVVMDEIEETDPELLALMKLHRVEAIVPFRPFGTTSACWALFGERFSREVHTPRDFKHLDAVVRRMEGCLMENVLPLHSEIVAVAEQLSKCKSRLVVAWDEIETLRSNLDLLDAENSNLSQELVSDAHGASKCHLPDAIASGTRTLQEYLREREAVIVKAALRSCGRDHKKAARMLGVTRETLNFLVNLHMPDKSDTLE